LLPPPPPPFLVVHKGWVVQEYVETFFLSSQIF
jgi:hypothetical protein